jgi:hypothetical protein
MQDPRTDIPQCNVEPVDDRRFHKRSVCHRRGAREIACGRQPPLCRSLYDIDSQKARAAGEKRGLLGASLDAFT